MAYSMTLMKITGGIGRTTPILWVLLFIQFKMLGQEPHRLFQSDEVLQMTLAFDQKEVYNDLDERNWHEAKISWSAEDGSHSELDIRVQVRGKTRAKKAVCRIPPLFLSFKGAETEGTPFHKQKKVKLVTHCKNSKSYKDYVKKEYLTYKLYNQVSPYSFEVRLCEINYVDTQSPDDSSSHFGFLIESIKHLAKRNDMKEYEGLVRNQESLDKDNIDKLVLYQYMIGNLDWSVPKRHNIKVMIGDGGSLPVAVPYDFDYSGLVDIPYAIPPAGIDIPDVTTRVFRGLCREQGYAKQIQFYKALQPKIMDEVNGASYLDEKERSSILDYIIEFYADLNNPATVQTKIDQACRDKHKHRYEYK